MQRVGRSSEGAVVAPELNAREFADLARASVTLSNDLELPAKIEELEGKHKVGNRE